METSELSYFVRRELEEGYNHFEVDLTRDLRTGKPKKDFRRVEVRYWKAHPSTARLIPCGDPECDQEFHNGQTRRTHQIAKKHGQFREVRVAA